MKLFNAQWATSLFSDQRRFRRLLLQTWSFRSHPSLRTWKTVLVQKACYNTRACQSNVCTEIKAQSYQGFQSLACCSQQTYTLYRCLTESQKCRIQSYQTTNAYYGRNLPLCRQIQTLNSYTARAYSTTSLHNQSRTSTRSVCCRSVYAQPTWTYSGYMRWARDI